MVWVECGSVGSKKPDFAPFELEPFQDGGDDDDFRVRHLIAKLVRELVRDFRLRESDGAFKVLTADSLASQVRLGKVGRTREDVQHVGAEDAVGAALQAFEDGLYLLFVDGAQKNSLEDRVQLALDSRVKLIRLTALSGRYA